MEVSPIGFKQVRTSDLTGADLPDDQVVTVLVRSHPDLSDGKVFDASVEEMSSLKGLANLVELELRMPDTSTRTVVCNKADFAKLVPDDKLKGFDSARGRRTGYRVTNGNGNGNGGH